MTKRNVLVVAYYFPPLGLSGVQRTLKFVKYLPQFGWKPTVLTVTPTGYYAQDESLLAELDDPDIRIERVGSLDPNRLFRKRGTVKMPSEGTRKVLSFASDLFFIPDNKIGWRKKAVARASELLSAEKYSVIFATAPPFTDLLIGLDLREKFNIPLVVDYRDPWYAYPHKYFPTPYHRWRNTSLEKRVLRRSSGVITTNRRVKELMVKRFKVLEYNDVTIIPQGFDPADFVLNGSASAPAVTPAAAPAVAAPAAPAGRLKITHAGVFYGGRSPRRFLEAVAKLRTADTEAFAALEVHLIGALQDEHVRSVGALGLGDKVKVRGYLEHRECVREMQSSDVLWLTLDNDTQSPGKLYEYLGARKPILACVPPGFVRQTLEDAGASIIVDPDDTDAIAAAIRRFATMRRNNALPVPDESEVRRYDRVALTNELSKIFGFLAE
jgi:glycosyltransferase involved in cell wall biosynthesis